MDGTHSRGAQRRASRKRFLNPGWPIRKIKPETPPVESPDVLVHGDDPKNHERWRAIRAYGHSVGSLLGEPDAPLLMVLAHRRWGFSAASPRTQGRTLKTDDWLNAN